VQGWGEHSALDTRDSRVRVMYTKKEKLLTGDIQCLKKKKCPPNGFSKWQGCSYSDGKDRLLLGINRGIGPYCWGQFLCLSSTRKRRGERWSKNIVRDGVSSAKSGESISCDSKSWGTESRKWLEGNTEKGDWAVSQTKGPKRGGETRAASPGQQAKEGEQHRGLYKAARKSHCGGLKS